MAKPSRSCCSIDIASAQRGLQRFAPYSTSPEYPAWKNLYEILSDVRASLDLVEAYKPGLIDTLVRSAYEEACLRIEPTPAAVSALITRYTTRRERP